ncbi:hypothetical protein PQ465_12275 [Sphingobacterium oryzagri]|uniref:Uncharacterized protein n=1 Tax=Sphingobacterium oryzagri TaxID=3025669 RepID=A0ABY7WC84_9SPHI|nr:hypothetical protein [Sphingobacterium sp. KACC 22765]WDF67082.1 hypothetical protein PQ465_12275 [Sphingobacterium sp. KACC 22765]
MKRRYLPPEVDIQLILIENTIAAGSAILNPGSSDTPYIPQIERWEEAGNDGKYWDI